MCSTVFGIIVNVHVAEVGGFGRCPAIKNGYVHGFRQVCFKRWLFERKNLLYGDSPSLAKTPLDLH